MTVEVAEKLAFSIAEVSRKTGLSRSFLYTELGKNRLRSVRAGDRRLVTQRQLAEYLALLEQEANEARA